MRSSRTAVLIAILAVTAILMGALVSWQIGTRQPHIESSTTHHLTTATTTTTHESSSHTTGPTTTQPSYTASTSTATRQPGESHACPVIETGINVTGLREFLESLYVPELRLLRATLEGNESKHVYLLSDNLLAYHALYYLNSSLSLIINKTLHDIMESCTNLKHEVLTGMVIRGPFYAHDTVCFRTVNVSYIGELQICVDSEIKSRIMSDWIEYADLVAYKAINETLNGNLSGAYQLFKIMMSMWDGWGFYDIVAKRNENKTGKIEYETYKDALAVYVYRMLLAAGVTGVTEYESVVNLISTRIIPSLQSSRGGIITGYIVLNGSLIPWGDENAETTSIVVLSLISDIPCRIGWSAAHSQG